MKAFTITRDYWGCIAVAETAAEALAKADHAFAEYEKRQAEAGVGYTSIGSRPHECRIMELPLIQ